MIFKLVATLLLFHYELDRPTTELGEIQIPGTNEYILIHCYRDERKGLVDLWLSGRDLIWGDGIEFTDTYRL